MRHNCSNFDSAPEERESAESSLFSARAVGKQSKRSMPIHVSLAARRLSSSKSRRGANRCRLQLPSLPRAESREVESPLAHLRHQTAKTFPLAPRKPSEVTFFDGSPAAGYLAEEAWLLLRELSKHPILSIRSAAIYGGRMRLVKLSTSLPSAPPRSHQRVPAWPRATACLRQLVNRAPQMDSREW